MSAPKRRYPSPPHNPGVRDLVEGKRAWDERSNRSDKRRGFRGWHERGYLPHRDSPGLTQFITFHLADAFPTGLLGEWSALLKIENDRERRRALEAYIDHGHGEAWLRRADVAEICEHALLHFHGQEYELKAWCLMPNHVHLLVRITMVPMSGIVQSWKGFSAYRSNQLLQRREEPFWAEDYWDTYMRDDEQERRTIRYIEANPVKARLVRAAKDWRWSSARFRDEHGVLRLPARPAEG
jgi:putative transposase